MRAYLLKNKTNDEIYRIITGLVYISLEKTLKRIQKYDSKRRKRIIRQLLWNIPKGMKYNNVKVIDVLEEYIRKYNTSKQENIVDIFNRRLKSANKKIENNQEDQLTNDEIQALDADQNKDGEITLSPLYDVNEEPLKTNDKYNSEIQVFE